MSSGKINNKSVKYGAKTIEYAIQEKEGLKAHYITVDKKSGVVLKGRHVPPEQADKLVLKKAKWILDKLQVVGSVKEEDFVTGSRIPYIGRNYYVQVLVDKKVNEVQIDFNESKFKITVSKKQVSQTDIKIALEKFYKEKAIEKLTKRVERWSYKTKLDYKQLRFMKMGKRWGSCTGSNTLIINIEAIKLPYSLIDYVIVHELCHTKVKDHSKKFWAELARHMVGWKELDDRLKGVRF